MKKVLEFFKKFWWLVLAIFTFVLGISLLERERKELQKKQKELKKEQKRLEKEAEEIEKTKYFDNPDSAAKFLNDALRKRK
ncbi:hypothetical protein SU69_07325 [Thermosipho melanesiensis]|uniref:CYTH domain-containing protein n=2 Tax=Thermosipho melanesiensis TaxID=46541 RepID=A6LMY9_THEM4|nr:hypothetical protein [Thermosipho melanesiensis]ABR31290.1 hypothetical protein Tmel_1443 [Thermosipho melanesiensis BI429]APT74369.1 hypothetical protein BW47_07650 [Thermosipho melanesiensis]OOC36312.1 hypothetical protein SU68_07395 [Thermosipho melanesiensis]OOC37130.1 hypothetical protein SU69_07325 [Thermosipho melanesiensis]OOC37882.1 hypothetical protein SU70_07335 [Thermosipho melanesiensis]